MSLKQFFPWLGIDSLLLWLARKLLFIWVKVTVVPDALETLQLDPNKPVFYLLELRSTSNLLVLEQKCLDLGLTRPTAAFPVQTLSLSRSAAAVRRWEGFWWRRPSQHRFSKNLLDLIGAATADRSLDVQLVPVSVFWGRAPEREQSGLKLLFGDSWSKIGHIRKFFIILAHGRNTWLQLSSPISLQAFVATSEADDKTPEQIVRKLSRVLRVHFRQQRQAAIGPDLSLRDSLIDNLMQSPAMDRAISRAVQEENISVSKARAQARRYAYEIAADFSYSFILFMRHLLRRLWDKLYDGVEVNHIARLQQNAPGHTVVYLPCHRSHIDYLLLSYVLFTHGLAIPHIAAGINLNLPLVGPFLRRGGAFFLRRSFKGNRLYGAVFHAYLSANLNKGVPLEYFVEGGRSRTGFSLTAKPGMLDMTVRGFLAHRERPVLLVPVYIGYEKLVEGRSYLAELSGQRKQKESLFGLLKSLKMLRSEFGKVHLNFSEPIVLNALLDQHHPAWKDEVIELEQRPDWLPALIDDLGRQVMVRINAAVAVNPINLLAFVLLTAPQCRMPEAELIRQIDLCLNLLRASPYSQWMTLTPLNGRASVDYALKIGEIKRDEEAITCISDDNAVLLSYFRNNVMHIFALAGSITANIQEKTSCTQTELSDAVIAQYPALQQALFLRWTASEVRSVIDNTIQTMLKLDLLQQNGELLQAVDSDSAQYRHLQILAQNLKTVVAESKPLKST